MKDRKLVETPVKEGPVKAKGGPIGPPEETNEPIVRDPPRESLQSREDAVQGDAKPRH
jgi:hypothetical protein